MTRLVLSDDVLARLRAVDEAELSDASGRVFGRFLSEDVYRQLVCRWANAQVSDEELQRRLEEPGGRTLGEIWSLLDKP